MTDSISDTNFCPKQSHIAYASNFMHFFAYAHNSPCEYNLYICYSFDSTSTCKRAFVCVSAYKSERMFVYGIFCVCVSVLHGTNVFMVCIARCLFFDAAYKSGENGIFHTIFI